MDPLGEVVGAVNDFATNYTDLRANNKGPNLEGIDKYFHCKANCQAVRHGEFAKDAAEAISDIREWTDELTGDTAEMCAEDQEANKFGKEGGTNSTRSCREVCWKYRPVNPNFPNDL